MAGSAAQYKSMGEHFLQLVSLPRDAGTERGRQLRLQLRWFEHQPVALRREKNSWNHLPFLQFYESSNILAPRNSARHMFIAFNGDTWRSFIISAALLIVVLFSVFHLWPQLKYIFSNGVWTSKIFECYSENGTNSIWRIASLAQLLNTL